MSSPLKIGNAQAFWGDSSEAAMTLLRQQPDLDFITLDYLAEMSMSIMAIQKEKDPNLGFAKDFLEVIESLIPFWQQGSQVKIIANAGGLNPIACARACQEMIKKAGCQKKVGVVTGDNVLSIIEKGCPIMHLDTGELIQNDHIHLVTANAYLGAAPLAQGISEGAEIIITGRVADPSLTVAPCIAHYNWHIDDYDKLAQATVAGHVIECGTQATGGIWTNWLEISDPENIGYPFIEMHEDGSFVITKPESSGGVVNLETVKEQLLYELGDPGRYLSPDVTVSFLGLDLSVIGKNRVHIKGAKGIAPPDRFKVSSAFRDGYRAEGFLGVVGHDAVKKGQVCGQMLIKKAKKAGFDLDEVLVECLGSGDILPKPLEKHSCEVILRICVADKRKEAVEFFTRQIAALATCGPQGVCGYTSGRPHVRPIFSFLPCLIDKNYVEPKFSFIN